MATRYYCDRCDKQVTNSNSLHRVTFEPFPGHNSKMLELCKQCIEHVYEEATTRPPVYKPKEVH